MHLAEWVRAGQTGERAKAAYSRTEYIEERAIDTMLDTSDAEVLSVTRLGGSQHNRFAERAGGGRTCISSFRRGWTVIILSLTFLLGTWDGTCSVTPGAR